ncbi:TraK domain-containing protein [Pantoea ananatis]
MNKFMAFGLLAAAVCSTATQAKTYADNTQRVLPEISTQVTLSNSDLNRVVCESGEAVKPAFSKEKPIIADVASNRRGFFVKLKYLMLPNGQNRYLSEPVELFLTCGDSTYELVINPEFGPPRKLILGSDTKGKIKDNQAMFGALSLEEAALMLTQKMITDGGEAGLPDSFEVRPLKGAWLRNVTDERGRLLPVEIRGEREVSVGGTGLRGTQYTVRALNNVQLKETFFLNSKFGENIFAITSENLSLSTGQQSSLVIIHRESM